ncbi:PAS domain S-box protein [Halarsenatibacter silvermanii]|uniref:PAS domain S-box-containing protein/diguanylate cyclase (GGDEF) domain-containing protein n=1 Tax=Halarsenatibacter silvermanii TaxID=321763 RepID=A0A1G9K4C7_9FIRM|nr:PAS domain S-box protein [Halarsenatibacter silvermanii]SDL44376.1 PAS domain S-box-containing protein/diguanylate cyclase (GGDEF) domain-containing protein [Halarsenatibacter silvermanii]
MNDKPQIGEFFDSWPYIAAIIDRKGDITQVNKEWEKNAVENGCLQDCGAGVNYLEVALNSSASHKKEAQAAAAGIKAVLSGEREIFKQRYSFCPERGEKWFEMKVKPYQQGALIIHEDITEYKKEEKRYEHLYKEYETVFNNLHSGVALINVKDGNFYYERVNPYHREIGGAEIENKIKGKTPEELFRKDIADKTMEYLRKCRETKQSITYETQLKLPAGNKHLLSKLSPVIIDDKVEKIVGIFQDITTQKRLEQDLKNINKEYETILDNSQSAIFLLNVENEERITLQRLNKTEEKLTGLSTEEVKGKTPIEVLGEEIGKEVEANYRECLEKRETTTYEEELNLPAGKKTWLTRLTPVIVEGKVEKIVGSSLDITELKEEKQWSDALFEESTSAIALLDENGEVVNINDKFRKIFGYKLSEIKDKQLDDVLENTKKDNVDREKTKKVLKGEKCKFEARRYDRDGNPYEFLIKGIPVKLDGEVKGIYAIFDDITESKQQREKLEAIYNASTNVAFVIVDLDKEQSETSIKDFSPGAENIFGYDRKEVLEKPVSILHPKETEDKIPNIISKMNKKEDWRDKLKLKRKNDKNFTAMLNVHPFTEVLDDNKVLGVVIDVSELEKTRKQLEYTSYHDELTDLYNRKFMKENMKRLDTERQLPISLIMLDVNGLKIINDTFGHEMGDRLLKKTSEILKDSIRQEDILARWAGDEFLILLPQTTSSEAEKIIERVENKCQQTYRQNCDKALKDEPPVSLGKGFATKTDPGQDLEKNLKLADEQMYKDKRKNGITAKREMINCLLHRLYKSSCENESHTLRITRLALKLGEKLGLSEGKLKDLSYLGSLHDIGKLTVDEEILQKSGALSEKECKDVKRHSAKGAKVVAPVKELTHLSTLIEYHHERWDGKGYPRGKEKTSIPLLARIIAIVDAYDVMTTGRPYKDSISKEEALEEIKECAGEQFDPELAGKFVEMMKEK